MNSKPTTDADRFRNFAKLIVCVPKSEVDKRAKAYAKARKSFHKARA